MAFFAGRHEDLGVEVYLRIVLENAPPYTFFHINQSEIL